MVLILVHGVCHVAIGGRDGAPERRHARIGRAKRRSDDEARLDTGDMDAPATRLGSMRCGNRDRCVTGAARTIPGTDTCDGVAV